MIAAATIMVMVLSSLGWGGVALRGLGVTFRSDEVRLATAFALGFAMLGWLSFFPAAFGFFRTGPVLVLVVLGLAGLWPDRALLSLGWRIAPNWTGGALAALAAMLVLIGLAVASGPPVDADSLAYHFTVAKALAASGTHVFEARAVEGAVPLLCQMTYALAYLLGGETAMTGWCLVSGWGAAWLIFAHARRWMGPGWALALALAWQTTPAVVYGTVNGQIEVRNAMFVLVACSALVEAVILGSRRHAALAGAAVGAFVGAKYPGLFLAFSGVVVLLACRFRWRVIPAYAGLALVVGGQWYLWNFVHTGDPLFPSLAQWVPYRPGLDWDVEAMRNFSSNETVLPRSLAWLLWYPFAALVSPHPAIEAGRTGFGPLLLILAPFAAIAAWRRRNSLLESPLTLLCVVALINYVLWFFLGPSQRLRHYLPLLPVVMIAVTAASLSAAPAIRRVVAVGFAATLALQIAGSLVYSFKYLDHMVRGQTRDAFLGQMINGWPAVRWINDNLGPTDKVLNGERELNYYLGVPHFYGHYLYQRAVKLADGVADPERYWRELAALGITHILVGADEIDEPPQKFVDSRQWLTHRLAEAGCAERLAAFKVPVRASRTLGGIGNHKTFAVYGLRPDRCGWKR